MRPKSRLGGSSVDDSVFGKISRGGVPDPALLGELRNHFWGGSQCLPIKKDGEPKTNLESTQKITQKCTQTGAIYLRGFLRA